jgi:hypothetical protein
LERVDLRSERTFVDHQRQALAPPAVEDLGKLPYDCWV